MTSDFYNPLLLTAQKQLQEFPKLVFNHLGRSSAVHKLANVRVKTYNMWLLPLVGIQESNLTEEEKRILNLTIDTKIH